MIFGLVGGLLRDEKTDYRHILTLLAFFWAAPFFGFFYGPGYAALSMWSDCQPMVISALGACAMPISGYAWKLALWLGRAGQ